MSCGLKNELSLCPKEDCSESSCPWGSSLKGLLVSSKLPTAQFKAVPLVPDDEDYSKFERLAEIGSNIVQYMDEGKNLVICSKHTGNGKTSWAIKLLQKYLVTIAGESYLDPENGIVHSCFVPTTQFIYDAKDFNGPYRDRYYKLSEAADKAEFVVWDDIGAAEYTKYDYTTLLVSIDRRVFSGKFNLFTTNLTTKKDMIKKLGERLADRIWDTSEIIEFKGKGVRC